MSQLIQSLIRGGADEDMVDLPVDHDVSRGGFHIGVRINRTRMKRIQLIIVDEN